MQCNVVPCRKVVHAHQTCGEREQGPDNISDVMCDRCYARTQPEIPAPSLKDKAKYYAKKFTPGGGSSSKLHPYRDKPAPLLDDQTLEELSEAANKKHQASQASCLSQ
ncbi:hypothetical protein CI102_13489 [Trichoderma harzianum]|uniref:Uncharacterized protein n=1 Tax=Trichoderma harzianum CBS 226.95 TaxID=983964 RepID=A0A2T4A613_TRIHA|nr:hypothetical protein M431DRAFT_91267 [Trichoderma harzianum CBS 226.95]PKK41790.1 hypothetical protein CI102_13489 [Trichoderma harzianum]PTB52486.1 hypothetical protein M431DRAFT_91267 [Trichoderma harzianum CBS 226.95]